MEAGNQKNMFTVMITLKVVFTCTWSAIRFLLYSYIKTEADQIFSSVIDGHISDDWRFRGCFFLSILIESTVTVFHDSVDVSDLNK